ncbi:MAG: outer membrane lipoprotein-sorting protein [Akkermansiaceae bacterium]
MNFKSVLIAAALTTTTTTTQAQQPDANAILQGARLSATLTQLDKSEPLQGNLTKSGKKIPIALFLDGKNIQFQFNENTGPWRIFHMRLADDQYDLFEMIDGKTRDFPANKLVEPIAGTDLTYEDLALRFFYWPNPKLEGEEDVGGQPCYKLRIDKPKGSAGRYEVVYVWVHRKFGAFMKIRGHNKSGGLIKEFQVEDIMKVADNVWTLRKMQVATHDPSSNRRIAITDLVFDAPKKLAPRGLR